MPVNRTLLALLATIAAVLLPTSVAAAAPAVAVDRPYAIGTVKVKTIWVNPVAGRDGRSGATPKTALRTLTAAWDRIPQGRTLTGTGYRIRIMPGRLSPTQVPNYMESRHGTQRFPIIIESAKGAKTVTLPGLNIFDARYLYLVNLRLSSQIGDVVHCERCDHFLLRGSIVRGAPAASGKVQETVKVNQSQHVYLERNDISGASDNPLDLVAVQHAAILANRIHDGTDWCAYAKGGSAYVRFAGNEVYDCGTGGFTAGQGTGFQFMTAPWTRYEAYDVKAYNNVIHDIEGAGLGVNGGYDVVLAHNTLYRTGTRDHLLEFVAGHRSCDGRPGDDGRGACQSLLGAGGWGTTRVDDGENYVRIPNRHVFVYGNLVYNPPGVRSQYTHFTVARPYDGPWQAGSGAPATALFDDDLQIRGNLIWNGPADMPTGLGGDEGGCRDDNATCTEAQVRADNAINGEQPSLSAATWLPGGAALALSVPPIPPFGFDDAGPGVAPGTASNDVPTDRAGRPRGPGAPPGAYVPG